MKASAASRVIDSTGVQLARATLAWHECCDLFKRNVKRTHQCLDSVRLEYILLKFVTKTQRFLWRA